MGLCLPLCKGRRLDQNRQFQTFYWNKAQGQSAREDAIQRKRTPCWPPPAPPANPGSSWVISPCQPLCPSWVTPPITGVNRPSNSLQYAQLILENYRSTEGRVSLEEGVLVLGWEGQEDLNRGRGAGKASQCGEEHEQCLGRECFPT